MLELLIIGAISVSAAALMLVHWRVHQENCAAYDRLNGKPFSYDFRTSIRTNVANAEQIINILVTAQLRTPDKALLEECTQMFELGYTYNLNLSVGANLAVMTSVLRALKG